MAVERILIDGVYPDETRIVITENNRIKGFDYKSSSKKQLKGNIYLAKVKRVEPSLQAAFVEFGGDKHGFIPFSEIHPDYYHIPVADRSSHAPGTLEAEGEDGKEEALTDAQEAEVIDHAMRPLTPPVLSKEELEEDTSSSPAATEPALPENYGNVTYATDPAEPGAREGGEGGMLLTSTDPNGSLQLLPEADVDSLIDDEPYVPRLARSSTYRQYKIQEVIKRNQIILVQVIKEERGNKGASLTSYLALAGRYCVLMPNSDRQGGISRRITDGEERRRFKDVIDSLGLPDGSSVIVRTAGLGRSKADIKRDYDYLVRLWNNIREHTLRATAPAFIHAESDLLRRTIRDLYDNHIDEVLIQGEAAARAAKDFMKMIMPSHANKVKQYRAKIPLFSRYKIEDQLASLYDQTVSLESGGYIVINQTEALIAIDVNSGRSTSERNVEETALKTNVQAAYEIARQLRLRDLSGLIVIDFIDMSEGRNRTAVEKALRDGLQHDRAKIQLGRISTFGLLEMSRQRLRPSYIEANTVPCTRCNGRGIVRAPESLSIMILRAVENEVCQGDYSAVHVYASADAIIHLLNQQRKEVTQLEEKYQLRVLFFAREHVNADHFSIEKLRASSQPGALKAPSISVEQIDLYRDAVEEVEESTAEVDIPPETPRPEGPPPGGGRKRNWKRKPEGGEGHRRERSPSHRPERTPRPARQTQPETAFAPAQTEWFRRAEEAEVDGNSVHVPPSTGPSTGNEGAPRPWRGGGRGGGGDARPHPSSRRNPRRNNRRGKEGGGGETPRFLPMHDDEIAHLPSRPPREPASPEQLQEGESLLKGLWKRIVD